MRELLTAREKTSNRHADGLQNLVNTPLETRNSITSLGNYLQKVKNRINGYNEIANSLLDGDAYDAERNLLHGTRDSPSVLAAMEFAWYKQDSPDTAPLYLARAVLPYLVLGNLRAANQCLLLFTSQLPPSLHSESVSSGDGKEDARIYPALPLLNFLTLLLFAIQRGPATGARNVFAQLRAKYKAYLQDQVDGTWDEAVEQIGETYFGVKRPRQSNPLMDMMGSMFGGGSAVGGRRTPAPPIME